MISAPILTIAVFALWLCCAAILPILRVHHRHRMFLALVLTGVPILGSLTLYWGPTAGVAGFAIGLWLLFRRPGSTLRRPLR